MTSAKKELLSAIRFFVDSIRFELTHFDSQKFYGNEVPFYVAGHKALQMKQMKQQMEHSFSYLLDRALSATNETVDAKNGMLREDSDFDYYFDAWQEYVEQAGKLCDMIIEGVRNADFLTWDDFTLDETELSILASRKPLVWGLD